MKRFFLIIFLFFLFCLILFAPLPFGEEILNESNYRKAHCFQHSDLFLCPNTKSVFIRPDGKTWTLETNEYGERVTQQTRVCEKEKEEVWLIGDSMSMGFLLEDRHAPGQVLENKINIPVRVMAVDALGTLGILRRFQLGQKQHGKNSLCPQSPKHVFWIWNTSDFLDDAKENPSFLKRIAYRLHYFVTKHSLVYLYLKNAKQEFNQLTPQTNREPYPKDHVTYQNLQTLSDYFQKENIPITLIYGWGMRQNGTPDTEDPNYFALPQTLKEMGLDQIDLRKQVESEFQKGAAIFIPNDGHPDFDFSRLVAEEISKKFPEWDRP